MLQPACYAARPPSMHISRCFPPTPPSAPTHRSPRELSRKVSVRQRKDSLRARAAPLGPLRQPEKRSAQPRPPSLAVPRTPRPPQLSGPPSLFDKPGRSEDREPALSLQCPLSPRLRQAEHPPPLAHGAETVGPEYQWQMHRRRRPCVPSDFVGAPRCCARRRRYWPDSLPKILPRSNPPTKSSSAVTSVPRLSATVLHLCASFASSPRSIPPGQPLPTNLKSSFRRTVERALRWWHTLAPFCTILPPDLFINLVT